MNTRSSNPIGIFDSGIGGLTVARAITDLLPDEQIIYFGDTAHLPYGDKSAEAVQHYAEKIADFLSTQNCKMIVIACNTASSVAYNMLSQKFGGRMPVINVIDPIVQVVAAMNDIERIGIIGTKGTIRSNIYEMKLLERNPNFQVTSLATPLLVPLIEEGFVNSSISKTVINAYLGYPDFEYIQALILACTHYPLVRREIEQLFTSRVMVFDSTDAVAQEVQSVLAKHNLLSEKKNHPHHFYVSDFTDSFEKTTRIFYKEEIHLEHAPIWE